MGCGASRDQGRVDPVIATAQQQSGELTRPKATAPGTTTSNTGASELSLLSPSSRPSITAGSPSSSLRKERGGAADEPATAALNSKKWMMLSAWTGWHLKDQFGWDQPALEEVVGPNGRSKLSGLDRPHDYQVSISFPGADFDKGSEGHHSDILDHNGKVLATSGTEMAEALQGWLQEGWLDGDEQQALKHIFVCSKNLKYCPGSIKAEGFRLYAAATAQEEGTAPKTPPADDSTAILNENWAMYLRESFIEARVVVFVVNQDWLDSIPCNQEFEALITRKRMFRPTASTQQGGSPGGSSAEAIIFMDITDEKYNQRWGAKLPQLKEGLAYEAGKHFDVFQFKYNAETSAEEKLRVQQEFVATVAKYATKLPRVPELVFKDLTLDANVVNWPNWQHYRALEGTNGWETLYQGGYEADGGDGFSISSPLFKDVAKGVASRRFRLRVTGVSGDTFNEGFKFMCHPIQLIDAATGENIIAEGKGYWKMLGEPHGSLGFSHWVGPKQYSWLEWLVPDDQPAVTISRIDVRANAKHYVIDAMPVDVWPSNKDVISKGGYTFLGFSASATNRAHATGGSAANPPKWVALHSIDLEAEGEAATLGQVANYELLEDARRLRCSMFRLRLLKAEPPAGQGSVVAASLQLKADLPEGLYTLGGGTISGSGGDTALEDTPPAFAFDGNQETRWVDTHGGGIGNTSYLQYEHPNPVEVIEYSITSQIYALSSYHSHMNGTPRDWTLKARVSDAGQDEWVVVDERRHQYFINHWETKRFTVASPRLTTTYRLEFSAIAAGCASRSIQVGCVELYARRSEACTAAVQEHQILLLCSAYDASAGPLVPAYGASGAPLPGCLDERFGLSWSPDSPGQLRIALPTHPDYLQPGADAGSAMHLGVVNGGKLGWTLGEGRVSNWYDHPMEIAQDPVINPEDPDNLVTTRHMLVVRPRKEPMLADEVHKVSFRREYQDGEVELVYTHPTPFVAKAYSLRSCCNYTRGDPRGWRLEAEVMGSGNDGGGGAGGGSASPWVTIHTVNNFVFADRLAPVTFYLLENQVSASRYRLVITEMNAMVALLHLADVALYKQLADGADASGGSSDAVPLAHREMAHVTFKVKSREGPPEGGGTMRLASYRVGPLQQPAGAMPTVGATAPTKWVAPAAWVLEGFTADYA